MQKKSTNNKAIKDAIVCAQINEENVFFSKTEENLKNFFANDVFALDFLNRMEKNWKQNIEPSYKTLNAK